MTNRSSGQIITFYSYKGGTGRTMALANLACLLARPDPSRKQSPQRRVLAIDWDFEAPGLHRFLQPYLEPESEKRFLKTPGCLELFQHLSSERVAYDPKDFVGNRKRARNELETLDLEQYLLTTQFPGLFLMKAGLFDDDYSRRASEFDWDDLFRTTVGLFAGVADFLRAQFEFVLVDSRTGITDTSGICTMLLPDKLVVVFTPNQQSLTGIESLVRKAVSYRKGSPDGRPLTVFPLPSRVEMARPQLLEAWRNDDGTNRAMTALLPAGTLGYQKIFEQLFAQIYARQEIHLGEYFNEVMLQHIPDYSYGEPVAVALETTESRISLSRSYEAFRDRLVELEVPWGSLKAARLERKIVRRCEEIADKLKEGAVEEAVQLSFALIEHKPSVSQFDRSVNAILDVAHAAYSRDREAASALIRRGTRLAIGKTDLDPATVGQALLDAGKLSKGFGDLTLATELLKASNENFSACFGAEHPTTLMVMNQLARIQQDQGDLDEARQRYQQSLEIYEKLGDQTGMASSYHQLGMLLADQGDYEGARQRYQQSLEIYEKLGDQTGMASSYHQLGMLLADQGDYEGARQRYQQSLEIYEKLGDQTGVASSYHQLGMLLADQDDYEEARQRYQQSLEIYEKLGNSSGMASSYHQLGMVAEKRGELDSAESWYKKSLEIKEALGNRPGLASSYHQLGMVAEKRGDLDSAESWYKKSLETSEALGNRPGLASSYHQLGMVAEQRGELDSAESWYKKSLETSEALGNRPGLASSYHQLGMVAEKRGDLDSAESWYKKSLETSEALGNRPGLASSYHQLGMLAQERWELDSAESWYKKSLEIKEALGNRSGLASSYHQLGMLAQERWELDSAESWYKKSLETSEALGNRPGMASSYHQLGIVAQERGKLDSAESWYKKSLEIKEALGNRSGMATSYEQLGILMQQDERFSDAFSYFLQAYLTLNKLKDARAQQALGDLCKVALGNQDRWQDWLAGLVDDNTKRSHLEKLILQILKSLKK